MSWTVLTTRERRTQAIGGTTAVQWAEYGDIGATVEGCGGGNRSQTYDAVWISVGGNDLLESGCTIASSDLKERMDAAVANVMSQVDATRYVLTGYCQPSAAESEDSTCDAPQSFAPFTNALSELASQYASRTDIVVHDVLTACGGSGTEYSPEAYFQDPIHLNANGYCNVFTQPEIQTAFGCVGTPTVDCDANTLTLTGSLCGLDEGVGSDDATTLILVGVGIGALVLVLLIVVVAMILMSKTRK